MFQNKTKHNGQIIRKKSYSYLSHILLITGESEETSIDFCSSSAKNPTKITLHEQLNTSGPKHATYLTKVACKRYCKYTLKKYIYFKRLLLIKGDELEE